MPTFKNQVISSSKWALINQVVTQGVRILVSIYLMRILSPNSFGVFMKVLAIVGVAEILVGLRMGGGIVQQKNVTQEQFMTIFWLNIFWSIILGTVFYLSGGLVSSFYDDSRVVDLVKGSSVVVLFMGIGYVPRSILTKALSYKKIFVANLVAVIISSALGIYLAISGYDYWSLFWLWASFNILLALGYFILSSFVPRFIMQPRVIISMWQFSKNIALNDLLNYAARNIDNIVIGRVLGSGPLGIYSRAYNIMLLPLQNFVHVINGVLFPSFSIIQDNTERIKEIFVKAVSSILFITLPFMLYGWVFARELTDLIFGSQWTELGTLLQILLILGVIQIQSSFSASVFMALGRSDLPLKISYIAKPILIAAILGTVSLGINKVALSITVVSGIFSFIQLWLSLRLIKLTIRHFLKSVSVVWIVNLILLMLYLLGQHLVFESITPIILIASFIVLMLGNIIFFELIKPAFYQELKQILQAQIRGH